VVFGSFMETEKFLKENKKNLVKQWFAAVIDTYSKESANFFQNNADPFANPVGNTIKRNLDLLFDQVIRPSMDVSAAKDALDPIVRIRAVQEFTPGKALSFILRIKQIIAKELSSCRKEKEVEFCIAAIDSNADELMLMAFDIYTACKHQIYSLRINEAKQRVRQLLIKKDLISELPESDTELKCI
jgi:hypothetical protein